MIRSVLSDLYQLTKQGIVFFAVVTAMAGYAISFPLGQPLDMAHPLLLILGMFFVSSGSFALNQAQEKETDQRMPRTRNRPVAAGRISVFQASVIGVIAIAIGTLFLYVLHPVAAELSLLTVVLYNGFYTMWWKRKWAFGAVPGAIPGAMPVVIGYAANATVASAECLYLFMIMFFWQMPHFWSLAIRYMDDYKQGQIPVLPAKLGVERTFYFIGIYTFCYVGLALLAPWFFHQQPYFTLVTIPVALKILYEFFIYFKRQDVASAWLRFFLWTNLSLIVFIAAPAVERWLTYFLYLGKASSQS